MRPLLVGLKLFRYQSNNSVLNKWILLKNLSSLQVPQVGAKAKLSRSFTAEDVNSFAKLSGDTNPLHLDEDYCSKTKFGKCIVHGALVNGLVSAVLGTVLPGPGTALVNQVINFTKPLYIGENVSAEITVIDVKKRFVECHYVCTTDEGKKVLDGSAKLVLME